MFPDLIFTAQSAALRVWVGTLDKPDLAAPSTLAGWSVADLVAHLVAVHDGVAALRPAGDAAPTGASEAGVAPPDPPTPDLTEMLTVADYVRGYAASAGRTADLARTIARDTADAPLRAWDSATDQCRRTLAALGAADRVVSTRRGQILASTYLTTRVIELVVHADDLRRALPHRPEPPVLPSARTHVLMALREVLTSRNSDPDVLAAASALDALTFVDLASGRGAHPDADVPGELAALLPLL